MTWTKNISTATFLTPNFLTAKCFPMEMAVAVITTTDRLHTDLNEQIVMSKDLVGKQYLMCCQKIPWYLEMPKTYGIVSCLPLKIYYATLAREPALRSHKTGIFSS